MANYPQKKKPKQEEMGSADDGAAYVKEKGRGERAWAEDAAIKTEERGARALEERMKETKYFKKGGYVKKKAFGGTTSATATAQPNAEPTGRMEDLPFFGGKQMAQLINKAIDEGKLKVKQTTATAAPAASGFVDYNEDSPYIKAKAKKQAMVREPVVIPKAYKKGGMVTKKANVSRGCGAAIRGKKFQGVL